ncbi:hypothetical protein GPX89_03730 [Nocardia sp. ET3-3]|uniref:SDR family oxidoreductase n=1 Tax=Nocardia terrae TaxID=2675851 RepID=A0A7K1UPT0_9NOCA|nr:hypothetical protein [Nocardia terrae]MVU76352.1 hypothetical protein [Nocardia terrae]
MADSLQGGPHGDRRGQGTGRARHYRQRGHPRPDRRRLLPWRGTPESIAAAAPRNPHGRLGLPSDIAPVVAWLVGDEAGWVSGQTIRANGAMF